MNEFNPEMNLNDIVIACWSKGLSPSDTVKAADAYGYIVSDDTVISMYSRMSATFNAFLAARAERKTAQLSHL